MKVGDNDEEKGKQKKVKEKDREEENYSGLSNCNRTTGPYKALFFITILQLRWRRKESIRRLKEKKERGMKRETRKEEK